MDGLPVSVIEGGSLAATFALMALGLCIYSAAKTKEDQEVGLFLFGLGVVALIVWVLTPSLRSA